jgi:type I restriction-modification system DNA methylase subunit
MARKATEKQNAGANLGFEAVLWSAADKLRGHMDAAEYKHVVLGLIFLKYISDAFPVCHAERVEASLSWSGQHCGIEADLGDELRQAEGAWAANADSFHLCKSNGQIRHKAILKIPFLLCPLK